MLQARALGDVPRAASLAHAWHGALLCQRYTAVHLIDLCAMSRHLISDVFFRNLNLKKISQGLAHVCVT